jgi:hypothetical protein
MHTPVRRSSPQCLPAHKPPALCRPDLTNAACAAPARHAFPSVYACARVPMVASRSDFALKCRDTSASAVSACAQPAHPPACAPLQQHCGSHSMRASCCCARRVRNLHRRGARCQPTAIPQRCCAAAVWAAGAAAPGTKVGHCAQSVHCLAARALLACSPLASSERSFSWPALARRPGAPVAARCCARWRRRQR